MKASRFRYLFHILNTFWGNFANKSSDQFGKLLCIYFLNKPHFWDACKRHPGTEPNIMRVENKQSVIMSSLYI